MGRIMAGDIPSGTTKVKTVGGEEIEVINNGSGVSIKSSAGTANVIATDHDQQWRRTFSRHRLLNSSTKVTIVKALYLPHSISLFRIFANVIISKRINQDSSTNVLM